MDIEVSNSLFLQKSFKLVDEGMWWQLWDGARSRTRIGLVFHNKSVEALVSTYIWTNR